MLLTSPLEGGERSTLHTGHFMPEEVVWASELVWMVWIKASVPLLGFGPQKFQPENKEKMASDNRKSKE